MAELGGFTPQQFAEALLGPVQTVVEAAVPGVEAKIDQLYEAVNNVATRIDAQAAQELQSAQQFAAAVTNLENTIRSQRGASDQAAPQVSNYLRQVAHNTRTLMSIVGKRKSWGGVSAQIVDISKEAQAKITAAINASCVCKKAERAARGKPNIPASATDAGRAAATAAARGTTPPGTPPAGKGTPGTPGTPGTSGPTAASAAKWTAAAYALTFAASSIALAVRKLNDVLDLNPWDIVPSLKAVNKFRMNIRALVFETVGYGNLNRDIEKSYLDIGNAVEASGAKADDMMKIITMNYERGIVMASQSDKAAVNALRVADKDRKGKLRELTASEKADKLRIRGVNRMKSVTATALNTANQLGLSMSDTNQLFMDWHMQLGLSATQMAEMGRHMQGVARQTGVTGDRLQQAMKSADALAKRLKSAGGFTAQAGKNIQEFTAITQKYGVGEVADRMMEALSSRSSFMEADPKMRSYLARISQSIGGQEGMDLFNEVLSGAVLQSRESMKKLGQGVENDINRIIGNFSSEITSLGIDPATIDPAELDKLMERMRASGQRGITLAGQMEQQFKVQTGMFAGDLSRVAKSYQEFGKTNAQKIADLNAEISEAVKAGRGEFDSTKEMQKRLEAMQTDSLIDAFSQLKTAATNTSDGMLSSARTVDIQAALKDNLGEEGAATFMDNLDVNANKLIATMRAKAEAEGIDFDDALKKRNLGNEKTLKEMLTSGEGAQMETALLGMNEILQKTGVQEKSAQDNIADIARDVNNIHNTLTEKLGGISQLLGNSGIIGKIVFWASNIVGGLATLGLALMGIRGLTKLIPGGIPGGGAMANAFKQLPGMLKTGATSIGGAVMRAGQSTGGLLTRAMNSGAGQMAGRFASKAAGPLAMIAAGIFGGEQAKKAGKTFAEGAGFGALTGGGTSKSLLGGLVGTKEGGMGDKALAVGESVAYGALTGAAIGSIVPVIGTGIGAAAGAIIAPVLKIIQMLGEKFQWVADIAGTVINPIGYIIEGIWTMVKGVWDVIAGIFTLDLSRIGTGLKKIIWDGLVVGTFKAVLSLGQGLWKTLTWVFEGAVKAILNLPLWILKGIKAVFLDFPKWIYDSILGGLQSLAGNEWIGPIIQPFLELWETVGEVFHAVYDPLAEVFDSLIGVFTEVKDAVWGAIGPIVESIRAFFGMDKAMEGASGILDAVTGAIGWLAKGLGWLIKGALTPTIWVIKGVAKVIGWLIGVFLTPLKLALKGVAIVIGWVVDAVKGWMRYLGGLWDVIAGLFTFDMDRVGEGLSVMGDVVLNALGAVWDAIKGVFWDLPVWLGGILLDGLGTALHAVFIDFPKWAGGLLLDGLKAVFVTFPNWLGEQMYAGWEYVKNKFKEGWDWLLDLPNRIWEGIKEAFVKLKDWVLSWLPGGETVQGAVEGFAEKADDTAKRIEAAGGGIKGRWEAAEVGKGAGRAVGGLKDVITGGGEGRWAGAKKAVGGAAESVAGAAKAVWRSKVNPLNWFAEGTKEISKTGLAVVHAGESVLPAGTWENIAAVGTGPFSMGNMMGAVKDPAGAVSGGLGMLGGALGKIPLIGDMLRLPADGAKHLVDTFRQEGVAGAVSEGLGGLGDALGRIPLIGNMLRLPADGAKHLVDTFRQEGVAGVVSEGLGGLGDALDQIPLIGGLLRKPADAAKAMVDTFREKGAVGMIQQGLDNVTKNFENIPVIGKGVGMVAQGAKSVVGKVGAGIQAVKESKFNPLNWFEEGSRKIENTGVAVVHKGEAVIPAEIWNKVAAAGQGAVKDPIGTVKKGAGMVKNAVLGGTQKGLQMYGKYLGMMPLVGKYLRKPVDNLANIVGMVKDKGVLETTSVGLGALSEQVGKIPLIGSLLKKPIDGAKKLVDTAKDPGTFGKIKDKLGEFTDKLGELPLVGGLIKGPIEKMKSLIATAKDKGLWAAFKEGVKSLIPGGGGGGGGPQMDEAEALKAAQTTAETMAQAQTPGSIYVHDIHVESVLQYLLDAVRGTETTPPDVTLMNAGAFQEGQAKEAMADTLTVSMKQTEGGLASQQLIEGILAEVVQIRKAGGTRAKEMFERASAQPGVTVTEERIRIPQHASGPAPTPEMIRAWREMQTTSSSTLGPGGVGTPKAQAEAARFKEMQAKAQRIRRGRTEEERLADLGASRTRAREMFERASAQPGVTVTEERIRIPQHASGPAPTPEMIQAWREMQTDAGKPQTSLLGAGVRERMIQAQTGMSIQDIERISAALKEKAELDKRPEVSGGIGAGLFDPKQGREAMMAQSDSETMARKMQEAQTTAITQSIASLGMAQKRAQAIQELAAKERAKAQLGPGATIEALSGRKSFMESDPAVRSFLARAASRQGMSIDQIASGRVIQDRETFSQFGEGIKSEFERFKKMTSNLDGTWESTAYTERAAQAQFGMSTGDMERLIQTFEEFSAPRPLVKGVGAGLFDPKQGREAMMAQADTETLARKAQDAQTAAIINAVGKSRTQPRRVLGYAPDEIGQWSEPSVGHILAMRNMPTEKEAFGKGEETAKFLSLYDELHTKLTRDLGENIMDADKMLNLQLGRGEFGQEKGLQGKAAYKALESLRESLDKTIVEQRAEMATADSVNYEDQPSVAADQLVSKKMGPLYDHSTALDHLADSLTKVKFFDEKGNMMDYDAAKKADKFIAKASAGTQFNKETGKYEEKFYYEVPMTKAMIEASKEAIKVTDHMADVSTADSLNYGDVASVTATDEFTKRYADLYQKHEETQRLKAAQDSLIPLSGEMSLADSLDYGEIPSAEALKTMESSLMSSLDNKTSENIKSMENSLSRSLDYGDDASKSADNNLGIVANLNRSLDYSDTLGGMTPGGYLTGTNVSPFSMDYTEDTKGMVSPLLTSRYGMEETVERERYGQQSSAMGVLPDMGSVADYLTTVQANYLSQMVTELKAIRENTSHTAGGPMQIGARGGGIPPAARPGVKNIAMDLTRGRWDLTFGDASAGAVTTDGRGGS